MNLSDLKDTHRGETCYILGNGPSLNNTDLSFLKDKFTIGLNRIYLKFPEIGFSTNIICCVNELVLQQFGEEISSQSGLKFLNARAVAENARIGSGTFLMNSLDGVGFNTELSDHSWFSGATVTFCALQVAYYLGFTKVVLLGVDHNFVQSGRAHLASKSTGQDANHFDPNYFGKNVVWQFPDLVESEINYETAREMYRINGREVVDGTVGGKLRIFPRVGGYELGAAPAQRDVPLATPEDVVFKQELPSAKRKIYEFLLSSRHVKMLRLLGIAASFLGSLWLLLWLMGNIQFLQPLLALLLATVGFAVFAATSASSWVSDWSRRRRQKDGRALIQVLKMIR